MGILEILKGWYTGTPQGVLHLMYYVHGYLKILLLRNCYQFAKTSTLCTTRLQKMIKEKYARTNYTSVLPVHTNIYKYTVYKQFRCVFNSSVKK